jgi:hypothetical protein
MVACLLAAALAAAPPKLAVLQVQNGEGVPPSTAQAITEAVVAEVRKQSKAEVITQREIASILSLEKQKAMMGCETDSCMAELGGALGADRLVAGDLAKLGESFLFHLRVVDVKKVRVAAQADRRLRGGSIDDVLDVLPKMVGELFPPAAPPVAVPAAVPAPQPTDAAAPAVAVLTPPPAVAPPPAVPLAPGAAAPPTVGAAISKKAAGGWTEEQERVPKDVLDRMYVFTDDDGLVIAMVPFQGIDAPFYAGDGEKLYRQRVIGGGQEGKYASSRVFWEPRAKFGAEASLDVKGSQATLTCGKQKIQLRTVGPGGIRRVFEAAKFYAPPFRRVPSLLARDDQGGYFLVDAAREPNTGQPDDKPDYRLRFGRKGALAPIELTDTIADGAGLVLVSASGRLVQKGGSIEWIGAGGKTALTPVVVRDSAPFIYGELGAYGQKLGTPCDGRFK